MDQRQIDIICTQLLQAFFQTWDQFFFAEIFNPNLGGDIQLVTRYAAFGNRLARPRGEYPVLAAIVIAVLFAVNATGPNAVVNPMRVGIK